MKCPYCRSYMLILELGQVEIDFCPDCHGIWLDEGELALLLAESTEKDPLLDSLVNDKDSEEEKRPCPRCRKKMLKMRIGHAGEVLIDQCRKGHGLWFDKGELHQVLRMGSTGGESEVVHLLEEMFRYSIKDQEEKK